MLCSGRCAPTLVATLVVFAALAAQSLGGPASDFPSSASGKMAVYAPLTTVRYASAPPAVPHPAAPSPLLDPHWANVTTAGAAAPPRGPATMTYDAQDGYVLWYGLAAAGDPGGATWTFASGTWINRTASAGAGPAGATWGTAADDPTDGYVLWYGGTSAPATASTWKFSGGKWTNLTGGLTVNPTPSRELASAADDPATGAVVLFGGWDGSSYLNDTWTFEHGAWSPVASAASPPPRVSAGLAFDAGDGYLLLAGGGTASGPAADSWAFNGTAWTVVGMSEEPVGLGGAQGLSAAPGGGVVGFGGAGCVLPLQGPCNFTYEFFAGAWHLLPPGAAPSARVGMQLTYDANDATVLGWGGSDGPTSLNDTWDLGGPLHLSAVADPPIAAANDDPDFLAFAGGGYGNYSFTWTGTPLDCPVVNASDMECVSEIPGNYTIVSHLIDAAGNATTAFAAFQVVFQFSSELVISPQTIDVGQTSNLRVVVSGGGPVVNYTWVGLPPDCSQAYGPEVNCTPTNPGYFSIQVTLVDDLGDVTTSPDLALDVNALPTVGVWSNASLGTAPFAVQFYASVFGGSPSYTFLWTFGDGTSATAADPSHTYTGSGVYAAGVRITDALGGAVGSVNLTIDVLNPLVLQPQASATYPTTGQTVTFSAVVSGGGAPYSYAWTFGDGATSSAVTPTHAFTSAGAHTIVLVVTDSHGMTAIGTVVVDVQGAASSGSAATSLLESPWVAGLIGAVIGIAVTAFAIRSPPSGPPDAPARRPTSAAAEDRTTPPTAPSEPAPNP